MSFIARLRHDVESIEHVRALFLSGSFGKGTADAYSDVDLLILVAPEHQADVARAVQSKIDAIEPIVFINARRQGTLLVNIITDRWLRCDLVFAPPEFVETYAKDLVRPLFDPANLYENLPAGLPRAVGDVAAFDRLVREFIRILGLLTVVDGRGEYVTGAAGAAILRGLLTELMLGSTAPSYRGGALHLSRALSAADLDKVADLALPGNDRRSVVEAHYAIARTFFPIARDRATQLGASWPSAFEAATRRSLQRHFGTLPAF